MKVLLDTHAFVWWDSDPTQLSLQARVACEDRTNVVLFSVASAWEMQIKPQLGKPALRSPLAEHLRGDQQPLGVTPSPLHSCPGSRRMLFA
jgi:PIN domain nuclease of toxin-antitoxin system